MLASSEKVETSCMLINHHFNFKTKLKNSIILYFYRVKIIYVGFLSFVFFQYLYMKFE